MKRSIMLDGEMLKIYPASQDEKSLIRRLFNRRISYMGRTKSLEYVPLTRTLKKIKGSK